MKDDVGVSDELSPIDDQVAGFKRAIEAVILVATDPVAPDMLAQLLEQPVASVERWCEQLRDEYRAQQRGFELARVAGGFRYQTDPDQTPYVERFVLHDQKARLSGAALETLAIIAYKQPISRAQVASIRGVDPDGVIRTTSQFLEKLGIDSLDDLPPIAEFIPDADVVEALEQGLRARPAPDLGSLDDGTPQH
jgi:segregation and condensation protein B